MNTKRPYSKVDELAGRARSRFSVVTDGSAMLNAIVLLSAILSAIFFWSNSRVMFAGMPPALGWALALLVGLMPAEGAFFAWKRVRLVKHDMTSKQLAATNWGLVTAVVCAIFSTLALFVTTFQYVPQEFQQYDVWLVFLALSVPTVSQVAIFAYFAVNERAVVENHERAKLGAMGFDAWIHGEQARIQSIIDGMAAALDKQLEGYGERVGDEEAGRILGDGSHELLNMGSNGGNGAAGPASTPQFEPTRRKLKRRPPANEPEPDDDRMYTAVTRTTMGKWEVWKPAHDTIGEAWESIQGVVGFGMHSAGLVVDSETGEPISQHRREARRYGWDPAKHGFTPARPTNGRNGR